MTRAIVARLDNDGDVLLAGPAVRAVAAGADEVTLLCGPRGEQAARLLPGVDRLLVRRAEWIDPEPPAVDRAAIDAYISDIAALRADVAVVLTSWHQNALPLALLLRMAGVPRIGAISEDYPGSLLDARVRDPGDVPEPRRALTVARAMGFDLPAGDDGRLRVAGVQPSRVPLPERYVVVHPGVSQATRAWPAERHAAVVEALAAAGRDVVVTGAPSERVLTARVAAGHALDLGGATTLAQLAGVIAGAEAIVVANTGPAHLAAAVGTPVVSLFAPTVPRERWAPYRVRSTVLGVDAMAADVLEAVAA
jgi:ADP-heptose:LPS heptosyltransferase